jgi:hypothetical protein
MSEVPLGLCQCGCGEKTRIATRNHTTRGEVKGQPLRYIRFHAARREPRYEVSETGCWNWKGYVLNSGYGGYSGHLAHRYFWEQVHGPIPPKMTIDHLCQNKLCVNPDHMEVVTNAENVRRSKRARLTAEDIREIRESVAEGLPRAMVARRHRIDASYVTAIASGKRWKDAPGPLTPPESNRHGLQNLRSAA